MYWRLYLKDFLGPQWCKVQATLRLLDYQKGLYCSYNTPTNVNVAASSALLCLWPGGLNLFAVLVFCWLVPRSTLVYGVGLRTYKGPYLDLYVTYVGTVAFLLRLDVLKSRS